MNQSHTSLPASSATQSNPATRVALYFVWIWRIVILILLLSLLVRPIRIGGGNVNIPGLAYYFPVPVTFAKGQEIETKPSSNFSKWDYQIRMFDPNGDQKEADLLLTAGNDGWELVQITNSESGRYRYLYFKRPKR
jgi:hypothetical protein